MDHDDAARPLPPPPRGGHVHDAQPPRRRVLRGSSTDARLRGARDDQRAGSPRRSAARHDRRARRARRPRRGARRGDRPAAQRRRRAVLPRRRRAASRPRSRCSPAAGASGCSIEDWDPHAGRIEDLDVAAERVGGRRGRGAARRAWCSRHAARTTSAGSTTSTTRSRGSAPTATRARTASTRPGLVDVDRDRDAWSPRPARRSTCCCSPAGRPATSSPTSGVRRLSVGGRLAFVAYGALVPTRPTRLRDEGVARPRTPTTSPRDVARRAFPRAGVAGVAAHPPAETWRKVGVRERDRVVLLRARPRRGPTTALARRVGAVARRRTGAPADVVVAFYALARRARARRRGARRRDHRPTAWRGWRGRARRRATSATSPTRWCARRCSPTASST